MEPSQQEQNTLFFKFHGNGGEYFKIWIVNLVLSILTLGIYSAWAKVRNNRYFYGNTSLNDASFEYHATPWMILKGRIIAVAALILYILISQFFPIAGMALAVILLIISPWAIWRSMQFQARMISYRNVLFSFRGSLKEAYRIILLMPLLPVIIVGLIGGLVYLLASPSDTLITTYTVILFGGTAMLGFYLIIPFVQKLVTSYYLNYHQYGQGKFSAKLSTGKYYTIYFALVGWTILLGIILSSIFYVLAMMFAANNGVGDLQSLPQEEQVLLILPYLFLLYFPFIIISLWGRAFLEARIQRHVINQLKLDDVIQFNSNIVVSKLFWIYLVNTFAVLFTLGLAYPWAIVRVKRYKTESSSATITGSMNQYINQQQASQSALGEEIGDAFDLDMGLGM